MSETKEEVKKVKIKVGQYPVELERTQRYRYRASKNVNFGDITDQHKSFSVCCDLVLALDNHPRMRYTPEDVAIAFEGKEEELVRAVFDALGVDLEGEEQLIEAVPEEGEKKD